MKYKQLTQVERSQIYILAQANYSKSEIARKLKRDKSTISREIKRNSGKKGYRYKQAHSWAIFRRTNSTKKIRLKPSIIREIKKHIKNEWSPEQISNFLKMHKNISISHETIYSYIQLDKSNGGTLYRHLRQSNKKRRKKYGGGTSLRGIIKNRVFIDKRPKYIDMRKSLGHWEGDTIIGKNHKGSILTLIERKSLLVKLIVLPDRKAESVNDGISKILSPIKEKIKTITFDNGKEFSDHESIGQELDAKIFFAHPYSFWERAINENVNGLVRQYFPKGFDFSKLTQKNVEEVEHKINNRPRKTLGFKTPLDVFWETT